jgi:hypothetical protein
MVQTCVQYMLVKEHSMAVQSYLLSNRHNILIVAVLLLRFWLCVWMFVCSSAFRNPGVPG